MKRFDLASDIYHTKIRKVSLPILKLEKNIFVHLSVCRKMDALMSRSANDILYEERTAASKLFRIWNFGLQDGDDSSSTTSSEDDKENGGLTSSQDDSEEKLISKGKKYPSTIALH